MTDHTIPYDKIDLSEGSPALRDLMERVPNEARNSQIILSDERHSVSANLTPEMQVWYKKTIAQARERAMDNIEELLSGGDRTNGKLGFSRRARDRQKHDALMRKCKELSDYRERKQTRFDELERIAKDEEKARLDFLHLCEGHERQPYEWPKWLYLTLLMLVGLAELAINWEAFLAIDNFTPAIATGTSLVIGLALAFSSHLTGMTMRQFKAHFGAAVDDIDRFSGLKMFGLAGTTLIISLGAVAYARYAFFQQSALDFGGGAQASLTRMVGGSMLSNILVWVVGVLIAYLAHDSDPEFPKKQRHLAKLETQRQQLQESLEKPMRRPFEQVDAQLKKELGAIENRHNAQANVSTRQEADKLEHNIRGKDHMVIAALGQYRSELLRHIAADATFQRDQPLQPGRRHILTPAEYHREELELKYV